MTPIPVDIQARAASEMQALPDGSAIVELLRASALDREKMRACFAGF